jgi:hypothetical protein
MKKAKRDYKTIHEIRMAKERYRYDTIVHREKLYNRTGLIFSNLSLSMRDWSLNVRSKLFNYSIFRTLFKTSIFIGMAKNIASLFRQPR